jgi:hypothetical protein
MGTRKLTYKDIPRALRATTASEAQRRLQAVLSDPAASPEQRAFARRQQGVLRHWTGGTLPTEAEGVLNYHTLVDSGANGPLASVTGEEHGVSVSETVSLTEH